MQSIFFKNYFQNNCFLYIGLGGVKSNETQVKQVFMTVAYN